MKKQYRTTKQFLELRETMLNGNWSQAALNCVEYGFSAKELQDHHEAMGFEDDIWDYVILVGMAERLRAKSYGS